jgi:hypothetical protein
MGTHLETQRARRKLEEHHRELRADLEEGAAGWIARRFLSTSAFGLGFTLVLPVLWGEGWSAFDTSSRLFWIRAAGPFVAAALVTPWMYVTARRGSRRSFDEVVAQVEADRAALTGPGWVRRTVRQGLWLAAGIGVPVGALMAFGFPAHELPGGSRLLAWGGFVLATAAWTLPVSFLFRWIALKSHGRLRAE